MITRTEHGTYGEQLTGATAAQIVISEASGVSRPYLVTYTFESWQDPLGTLEVLDVARLRDEFGTGHIGRVALTDHGIFQTVEREFRALFRQMVRTS